MIVIYTMVFSTLFSWNSGHFQLPNNIRMDNLVDINSDRHVTNMDRDCRQSHQVFLNHCIFRPRGTRGGRKRIRTIKTVEQYRPCKTRRCQQGSNSSNLVVLKSSDDTFCNLALLNTQSVVNKIDQMTSFLSDYNLDICCITETWLQPHNDFERQCIAPDGYCLLNKDREGRRGGGVAIICRERLNPKMQKSEQFRTFECMLVSLSTPFGNTQIATVYRPPDTNFNEFLEELTSFLETVTLRDEKFLICGDFNVHLDCLDKPECKKFLDVLQIFDIEQHVKVPTHRNGHILDLILSRSSGSLKVSNMVLGDSRTTVQLYAIFLLTNPIRINKN